MGHTDSTCILHGIYKTTGYDPNANPAEPAVGILKRRARYLLSGARLPINWWGLATLAAAQLCRADAGLEEYPKIPFGTRVMLVRDPTPRNALSHVQNQVLYLDLAAHCLEACGLINTVWSSAEPVWRCRA